MAWLTRAQAAAMTEAERLEFLTYTVLGEAVGEDFVGMVVVGQVIHNRTQDSRFPSDPVAVAGQSWQFTTHADGSEGNQPYMRATYKPGSIEYRKAEAAVRATIIDQTAPDITGRAINYHTVSMGWPASWPSSVNKYGHIDIGNHRVYPTRPTPPADIPGALAQLEFEGVMVGTMLDVRRQGLAPIRPASLSSALTLQRETNRIAQARARAPETIRRSRALAFNTSIDPFDTGRPSRSDPIINRPEPAMKASMRAQLRATGTPNMTERTFALQNAQPFDGNGPILVSNALLSRPPAVVATPWGVRETVAAQVAAAAADNGRNQMVMSGNPNIAGSVVDWLYPRIEEGAGEANQEGKGPRAPARPGQSIIERSPPPRQKPGQSQIERSPPKPADYDADSQDEWAQRNSQLNIAAQNSGAGATAAVRVFAGSVIGDRSPIDESSFTRQEIDVLAAAVARAQADGRNYIGYGDFGEADPWAQGTDNATQAMTDRGMGVANTIGMARFSVQRNGSIVIEDSYDFNASRASTDQFIKDQGGVPQALMAGFVRNGLLGVGNVIGNMTLPEGEGRPVKITIPFDKANIARRAGQTNIERGKPIVVVTPAGARVVPQSIIERDDVVTQSIRRANQAEEPALAATLANQIATRRTAADVRTIRNANQSASDRTRRAVAPPSSPIERARVVIPGPSSPPKKAERLVSPGGLDFIDPPRTPPRLLPPIAPPRSNPIGIMPDFKELAQIPSDPLRPVSPSPGSRDRAIAARNRVTPSAGRPVAETAEVIQLPVNRPTTRPAAQAPTPADVETRTTARNRMQAPVPASAAARDLARRPTTRAVTTTRVTTTAPQPASVEDRVTARNTSGKLSVGAASRSAAPATTRKTTSPVAAQSSSPSQSSSRSGSGGSQAPTSFVRASTGESLSAVTVRSYDPDTNSFSSRVVYR